MLNTITQDELIKEIKNLISNTDKSIILAIDGRCASGKTTLAKNLADTFGANLFHADDYFLRPEQRTEERLETPGGNFDIERFKDEIINGINSGKDFYYSPFDCKTMTVGEKVFVKRNKLNIIEGSYCCHPEISHNYNITVFVTTDKETQIKRIIVRNKEKAEMFFSKWIPFEEKYFSHFNIESKCNFTIKT